MDEDEQFVPRFAKGRAGNHSASSASRSLVRAFAAFAGVLVLAGGATYGLDMVAVDGALEADVVAEPSPSPEPSPSAEVVPGRDEIFLSWGPSLTDWQFAQAAASAMTPNTSWVSDFEPVAPEIAPTLPAPALVDPVLEPAQDSLQGDNCPTCAATLDGLKLDVVRVDEAKSAS